MNKHVLITGASGGVAQALIPRLVDAGCSLALVSRERSRLPASSTDHILIEADCSTAEGAKHAVATAAADFGAPPDGLVHLAGNSLIAPLHRTREAQLRECLAANLESALFTLGAYVEALQKSKRSGSVVMVSSVVAQIGVANHEVIAAAKAGVEALCRSAAATYSAQGLRINAIAPGLTRTPLTERLFAHAQSEAQVTAQYPLGRHGQPDDLAAAIAWLLGDESSWISGQVLPVDGGFTAVRPIVRPAA